MDNLMEVVKIVNGFMWDKFLVIALCLTGIFFSYKLDFIQFRRFFQSVTVTFGSISFKGLKAGADGMSSFQSLATSIASQIGTGNLAGVATAMVAGGPGAIFWMWISAILGMAIIYAEATLAQKYKTTINGEVVGGPVYYIQAAFKGIFGKILAVIFSIFVIVALGFMGSMVQANSIGEAMYTAFNMPHLITGIILALLALMIFLGGVQRIVAVTEKIVPLMALFFTIISLYIIFKNRALVLSSLATIFVGAFNPNAVLGGVLGVSVKKAVRYGVSRGLFTHEAGMGSTPHAHALARVKHPCEQGLVAMMGVFIDTIVLLPMTVLVILTTGSLTVRGSDGYFLTGIELTQYAYSTVFGQAGYAIVAISVLFFAFATIVGWYFFGLANIKFLFGKKALPIYAIAVSLFIVIGCVLKVDLVWNLADLFNGFMVIPNLLALLALSNVVCKLTIDYDKKQKKPPSSSRIVSR